MKTFKNIFFVIVVVVTLARWGGHIQRYINDNLDKIQESMSDGVTIEISPDGVKFGHRETNSPDDEGKLNHD